MAYVLNDGQGSLFKNDKGGNDRRPDYRGSLNIGGTIYRLSAWVRDSQKGGKFLSLSAEEEAEKPAAPTATPGDNDLPF